MPQAPPPATLPQLVLRYAADAGPPPPPPVPASTETEVECGQVIRQSIKVANDLHGCPGEGLVVGAANIVVDLNGHTIHPPAVFVDPGEEDGLLAGVRNSGYTNVVIRNGTVKGYGYGVLLTGGTTHNVIEDMTLDANLLGGIELNDADDGRNGNTIQDNLLTSNGESAISLINGSENSVIRRNNLDGNGGVGFQLIEADGHLFEDNVMSGVPINPLIDSDSGANLENSSDNVFRNNRFTDFGDAGFVITASSHRNLVEGNTMVRSGDAGVYIQDSADNRVIGNTAHASSDGGVVVTAANGTVVRGNDVRFNPSGVDSGDSNNVVIENNDASHSLQSGIEAGNGLNLRIVGNTANSSGGAGISVESGAFDINGLPIGGALIAGNTANENAETGINVADGGHTVTNNDAHNNAGFGISIGENPEAPGEPFTHTNIDGPPPGTNKASGNGEVTQCSGLVCDTTGGVPLAALDTEPPQTVILTNPSLVTSDPSPTFTFEGLDNVTPKTAVLFECRIDNPPDPEIPPDPETEPPHPEEPPDPDTPPDPGNWIECGSPFHVPALEQGPHHFEVRAYDNADNVDPTPATYDWEIDITVPDELDAPDELPPNTFIAAGPLGEVLSTEATFRFTGSDNLIPGPYLTFVCRLDGEPIDFEDCTTPETYSDLLPGVHTFEVAAVDLKGNVDPTPAVREWTILVPPTDLTPPDTTIESGPDPITVLNEATFVFSSEDSTATFECRLNLPAPNDGWEPCTSPKTYTGVPTGAREFQVQATDRTGNFDPTPAKFTWYVGAEPAPGFVFCGQVVKTSIKLRNDLADCLWDGLVVGAPNITIHLDGHTIDGKGVAAGIHNDGYDNVTIK